MIIRGIKQLKNIQGKRVLVRVDFNVPVKEGKILDDSKLKACLPTIKYLSSIGAKVILMSHLGRPNGKIIKTLRIDPVIERLEKLLRKKVIKLNTENWRLNDNQKKSIVEQVEKMKNSSIAMMENIRFAETGGKEDKLLTKKISDMADIYVFDGFAVAHRESASVTGPMMYLPSYGGLLLQEEMKNLDKILKKPKSPFVVILGGAKIETKLPIIKNLLNKADFILIGGAIANTYFFQKGYQIGDSLKLVEMKVAEQRVLSSTKIIKPVDVVVGNKNGKRVEIIKINDNKQICSAPRAIFDIGPKTIEFYSKIIAKAKTLVWNGAMGFFEQDNYKTGTYSIAKEVADRSSLKSVFGMAGGGETLRVFSDINLTKELDFASTGGGAMLEYLSDKKLPAIELLKKHIL